MDLPRYMNACRLHKFRKSANLTQREVAALVGYASQRAYSDMEIGNKRPALGTALGCSILFDAPAFRVVSLASQSLSDAMC